jgi:hypothetical protein
MSYPIYRGSESDVDNTLVAQKDRLLDMVNDSVEDHDPMGLNQVLLALSFVADLWIELGYGYKVGEVAERVAREANAFQNISRSPKVRGNMQAVYTSAMNLSSKVYTYPH